MRALEGDSSTSSVEKEIWAGSGKFRFPAIICGFFFLRRHTGLAQMPVDRLWGVLRHFKLPLKYDHLVCSLGLPV